MSNMSDQTDSLGKRTRLIVGEVGVDTETGIVGKGHSYDNGKTFTVDDTIYGRIYHADDHAKIWQGIQDQVSKLVARQIAEEKQKARMTLITTGNLASLGPGSYEFDFDPIDSPVKGARGLVEVLTGKKFAKQTVTIPETNETYFRTKEYAGTGIWSGWRQVTLWS